MANQKDLNFIYSTIDEIFRLSMGETGDFSGAMYNGDFSMALEEAQEAKHRFIVKNLNIGEGTRVLDLGCGWGPFLNYAQNKAGAECVGLTLAEEQVKACRKNGFEVYLKDCRAVKPEDFGRFDAAVSLGAFEHFCSIDEYLAGKQEEVYRNFFKTVYDLLPPGGRFFLQTMVFGKNMLDYEEIDIEADKNSNSYILALMIKQFPGSWLPYGPEMITRAAAPFFNLAYSSSGRLDYIETIAQWRKNFRKFNLRKYFLYLSLLPNYFTDKEFRHRVAVFRINPNKVCFEREVMDHYRMVFEKK
ncbi:MAG: class I SAM-dependent methyltransferase [Lewinellaceae bacterium]|nr:class I SAM-dependent methyltransferase [Phaeodactylibacter sp.]MCB9037395.1 class I SAM-dependent methyltransferase [Lewinellaceae bacterium]